MNAFFKGICQMGIFMICAQAIVHFRPDGSYEKYLKMLVSVMILVQVFLPVAGLFSSGMQRSMEERIAGMERQIQESMAEAGEAAGVIDGMLDTMTLEEVRERVARQQEEVERQEEINGQKEAAEQTEINRRQEDSYSPAEQTTTGVEIEIEKVRIGAGGRE